MQLPGRVDTFVGMSFRRGINGDIPATRALQREKHGRPAGRGCSALWERGKGRGRYSKSNAVSLQSFLKLALEFPIFWETNENCGQPFPKVCFIPSKHIALYKLLPR